MNQSTTKIVGLQRSMMILFFTISFIPAILIALISFAYSRSDLLEALHTEMTEVNTLKQQLVLSYVDEQVFRAQVISESEEVRELFGSISLELERGVLPNQLIKSDSYTQILTRIEPNMVQRLTNNSFEAVTIISAKDGTILYSYPETKFSVGSKPSIRGNTKYLQTMWEGVSQTRKPTIMESEPLSDGRVLLITGILITDAQTQQQAIVVFEQSMEDIYTFAHSEFNLYDTRDSFILDHDLTVITPPIFPHGSKTLGATYNPAHIREAVAIPQFSDVVYSDPEQKRIILASHILDLQQLSHINSLMNWYLITQMDYNEFGRISWNHAIINIIIALIVSGIAMTIGTFMVRRIIKPIVQLDKEVSRIAQGYLDFTSTNVKKDEIGSLERNTEAMVHQLRNTVALIENTIQTTNQMALSIASSVEEQSAISVEQAGSVAEISSTMDEFSTSFTQVSENVSSVSEMIQKILTYVTESSKLIHSVAAKMEDINGDNERDISHIMDLKRRSKEIAKVMEIINSISDQTKIIAFNAALEASSAGEAGKRFGVVASEIRKLTENVMESTSSIDSIVSEIQSLADQMVLASEKTTKNIGEGLEYSSESVENMEAIISNISSSNDATKQIVLSVQQQKSATAQIQIGLKELSLGAKQNSETIQNLNSMGAEFKEMGQKLATLINHFKLHKE